MILFWWMLLLIQQVLAFMARFILTQRYQFEKLNETDPASESFYKTSKLAFMAFEISSEGEWEQVRALVIKQLDQHKLIEIIYSSESLSHAMANLFTLYPKQVRILRMPILSFSIGSDFFLTRWITAPSLTLVRYDFFPELLAQKHLAQKKLFLRWATLKNKSGLKLFFQLMLSKNFDYIYPATHLDEVEFKRWLGASRVAAAVDGRTESIKMRLIEREKKFSSHFPFYPEFKKLLKLYPKRILLGSGYLDEMEFVLQPQMIDWIKNRDLFLSVIPHKLDLSWQEFFNKNNIPYYRLYAGITLAEFQQSVNLFERSGGIWLIDLKGILCELYADFPIAYVGGGFHRSVHSTLEPFLAGATVLTGPKIHRSTEVMLISEWDSSRYHLFPTQYDVFNFIKNFLERK